MFNYSEKIKREIEDLKTFFDTEGYYMVSNDIAHEVVSDIETELIEKDKVMIFNCLFTDIISI